MFFQRRLYCLMASGMPLDDVLTDALLRAARDMLRKGEERWVIGTEDAYGIVETRFRTAVLGTLSGVVFQAEIETDFGKTRVSFIVDGTEISDRDFERLQRSGWSEHPASRAHLN